MQNQGAATAGAALDNAARADLAARRRELRLEFNAVQQQLRPTQIQALDSPGVRHAQARFEEAFRQRMVQIDPRAEEWLARAEQVGRDLEAATTTDTVSGEAKRRIAAQLDTLMERIDPVQEEALHDPVVGARFQTLRDSLVATIVRIQPSAEALIERMDALEDSVAAIDVRLTPPVRPTP